MSTKLIYLSGQPNFVIISTSLNHKYNNKIKMLNVYTDSRFQFQHQLILSVTRRRTISLLDRCQYHYTTDTRLKTMVQIPNVETNNSLMCRLLWLLLLILIFVQVATLVFNSLSSQLFSIYIHVVHKISYLLHWQRC